MQVNVDYSNAINELGAKIADLTVTNALLKAQLTAVTNELNTLINNASSEVNPETLEDNYGR